MRRQRRSNAEGVRPAAHDRRAATVSVWSLSVSFERLRRRSRPVATITVETFKQTALSFVGEPVTRIETQDPGDVALGGALARALDGIDDAAQKAALREARLS